jgi:uncharacterized membrane protein YeaQ/YmgE (transglycosylase-associated protein family)
LPTVEEFLAAGLLQRVDGNPAPMHFIWFLIVGAIVGALGRLLHPGSDPMGWLLTIAIGVVSLLIAAIISSGWLAFVIGVIVAIVLVALVSRFQARRGALA